MAILSGIHMFFKTNQVRASFFTKNLAYNEGDELESGDER